MAVGQKNTGMILSQPKKCWYTISAHNISLHALIITWAVELTR